MTRLVRFFFMISVLLIGATSIRITPSLTVSDLVFIVTIFLWGALGFEGGLSKKLLVTPISFGFAFIIIGACLSLALTTDPLATTINTIKFIFIFVIFFVLGPAIFINEEQYGRLTSAFSLSIVATMVGVLGQIYYDTNFFGISGGMGRLTGLSEHPNELGLHSSLSFFSGLLLLSSKSRVKVIIGLISILISIICITLAASMTAFAALACGIFVLGINEIYRKNFKFLSWTLIATTFAVIISLSLVDTSHENFIVNRIKRQLSGDNQYDTLDSRMHTNEIALQKIAKSPFIGVGSSSEDATMSDGSAIHNIFLRSFAEGGLFQFLGILLVYFASAKMAVKHALTASKGDRKPVILLAMYICIFVGAMFAPITIRRIAWIPFTLILVPYFIHRVSFQSQCGKKKITI